MATSSLYKTFALRTREETDIFMQKFEEHLRIQKFNFKEGIISKYARRCQNA